PFLGISCCTFSLALLPGAVVVPAAILQHLVPVRFPISSIPLLDRLRVVLAILALILQHLVPVTLLPLAAVLTMTRFASTPQPVLCGLLLAELGTRLPRLALPTALQRLVLLVHSVASLTSSLVPLTPQNGLPGTETPSSPVRPSDRHTGPSR